LFVAKVVLEHTWGLQKLATPDWKKDNAKAGSSTIPKATTCFTSLCKQAEEYVLRAGAGSVDDLAKELGLPKTQVYGPIESLAVKQIIATEGGNWTAIQKPKES